MKHENRRQQLEKQYRTFREKHPHYYPAFCRETFRMLGRARPARFNGQTVIYALRNKDIEGDDGVLDFKVNNNLGPYFMRDFIRDHPEYADRFELRRLFSEDHLPLGKEYGPPDVQPDLEFDAEIAAIKKKKEEDDDA